MTIRTISQELQAECECCDRTLRFTVMGDSLAALRASAASPIAPTASMEQSLKQANWLRLPSYTERSYSKHVCPKCAAEIAAIVAGKVAT